MSEITLKLYLCDANDNYEDRTETVEFTVCDCIESDIEQWLEDYNADIDDADFDIDDKDIVLYDEDYPDPGTFSALDEYGALVEKIDEHGPAYLERYNDRGDFDWDDEFNGQWDSEEEFVQQMYEDCYDIPDHLQFYIAWDRVARDVMMDYDSYYVDGEYFIFRA